MVGAWLILYGAHDDVPSSPRTFRERATEHGSSRARSSMSFDLPPGKDRLPRAAVRKSGATRDCLRASQRRFLLPPLRLRRFAAPDGATLLRRSAATVFSEVAYE